MKSLSLQVRSTGRYFVSAAFVASLTAMLAACSGTEFDYPPPQANAAADSVTIRPGSFKIGSETYAADFGTITVPECRSKPGSRLIDIPFLRIHSKSETPSEPVFGFAGGPGMSNMSWDWGKAHLLLSNYDFVLVGYRGVDGSTVLDCPEVAEAFRGDGDILGDQSMKTMAEAWGAAASRLTAEGIDLEGYTMPEVIEDNESVRRALGYTRIDLLSESYGTRAAYLYGLKHRGSIFRSAMIAVNPPGRFVWEPETIDWQLRYYSALWAGDSAASARCANLYATMARVLDNMPRRWLFFPIDAGKVKVVTFALLFHRKTAATVFDAYVHAGEGDASGLALMSLAYDFVVPTMGIWGDLAAKAVSADFDSTRDYCANMDPPWLPLGSPMSKVSWCPLKYGGWPTKLIPEEFRRARPSEVQTLLISGSIDFSTPAENATKGLLPYLKNGRQVILSECGHVNDDWYANPDNTRLILTSFYDTGLPDTSKNTYVPMDFKVGWDFPAIAKAAVSGGAVLILAVLGLAVWVIRKVRRRRA